MTDHLAAGADGVAEAGADAVRHFLDIEAIKQLKARYFRLLDTKQWGQWGEVFSTGVRLEVPDAEVAVDGRVAVVEFVSGSLAGARTVHHGHTPEIELTGADSARGIWAMEDHVEWSGEDGAVVASLVGYGHYHEEYVREDGRWCIASTRLERLRVDIT